MYSGEKTLNRTTNNRGSMSKYVEGFDVFNSKLLLLLDLEPESSFYSYEVRSMEKRPDLISKFIYKDDKMFWVILYTSRISADNIEFGTKLRLIDQKRLTELIDSL